MPNLNLTRDIAASCHALRYDELPGGVVEDENTWSEGYEGHRDDEKSRSLRRYAPVD